MSGKPTRRGWLKGLAAALGGWVAGLAGRAAPSPAGPPALDGRATQDVVSYPTCDPSPDGDTWTVVTRYDAEGRCISVTEYDPRGTLS